MMMGRSLLEWQDNEPWQNALLIGACTLCVLLAGFASGLTLGLMSLDATQLEVLRRSGTAQERKHAAKIMPVLKNSHHLLVTLLLVNALAMEALPLFLDRLVSPFITILMSVSAVLLFGEIIPQAICSKYGLVVGAKLARLVKLLMLLTSPISWPFGKLLDAVLGHEGHVLFRRQQLKVLMDLHGEGAAMGDKLSLDEIKVIRGALDLTSKIAYRAMTPLDRVFMLSTADVLSQDTLRLILESGHSRVPVFRAPDRTDLVRGCG
ncbi:hypothetical protein V8C86DRAFT_2604553 [Haematococcus lacustris]